MPRTSRSLSEARNSGASRSEIRGTAWYSSTGHYAAARSAPGSELADASAGAMSKR